MKAFSSFALHICLPVTALFKIQTTLWMQIAGMQKETDSCQLNQTQLCFSALFVLLHTQALMHVGLITGWHSQALRREAGKLKLTKWVNEEGKGVGWKFCDSSLCKSGLIDLINSLTLLYQPDLTHKPAGNKSKKNTKSRTTHVTFPF